MDSEKQTYTYEGANVEADSNGSSKGTASMVLGIISVVIPWFGLTSIISIVLGIIGLVMAGSAKKNGYTGGKRTAGIILSIIGLLAGVILTGILVIAAIFAFRAVSDADPQMLQDIVNGLSQI